MTSLLYSMRLHRPALAAWARTMPREIGALIFAEAFAELMAGDSAAVRALPFVNRLDTRCRRLPTKRAKRLKARPWPGRPPAVATAVALPEAAA